jgi:TRAP-type transport system periplasmic protein
LSRIAAAMVERHFFGRPGYSPDQVRATCVPDHAQEIPMRLTRRTLLKSAVASAAAPVGLGLAKADAPQVTLKLHHAFSAVSAPHEKFLALWARQVEAASGGRIRIELFPSMQLGGAPAQLFDQARDGIADIVWTTPGGVPGRFAKIEAFELPFVLSRRALVNSKAIEDFAAANLRDEFREIRPLCFSCRDHGILHASRSVKSIDDLKGLRLHVPNRLAAEAVRALGAHGVTVPMPQVPMALAAHAIDGCLDPWDAVPSLRLNELLKYHTDFAESALSTTTFVLAMNNAAYERLPRDLKPAIDQNAGLAAAGLAGTMWELEAKAVADGARDRGDPIVMLSADEVGRWRRTTEPVIAAWQTQMKARGLDGGRLIAAARELVAKYAAEPEPQPVKSPQASQSGRSSEHEVVAEPAQFSQAKAETLTRRRADAPPVQTLAPSAAAVQPGSAAASKPTRLDIPL